MELSKNDKRLLKALQRNARQSVSELARELDLSRTTVQKRLTALESNGVITGYKVKLSDSYRAETIQAYVNLVVDPRKGAMVTSALEKLPQVEALYTVSGKIDMVALMRVHSPAELDTTLDRIGETEGVRDTDSAIVLSTKFDRR
ncbi:AsnC family transcriptional regulator [Halioglobus japonicus]|uniref:Lrp/AsnC family transcriptional regulator n=1 Tax=Halioglobus japonicus TaxID=930805 RepID=A0AAP8SPL2_9GAMM|nr:MULTISPECIES: Lrp/AsnC family transcriptional regulator [Halioglobus]AQA19169.1 AsnC family transcriptional regulator [Halioglobus japonicus]KZX59232.1 AsnC family transcriptional regulator [Halioglobus sp. HI00S01]PLW87797.1 Lrp/AsnC family transcriptional regulator [Halioglobus japonicus]GHD06515.1 AsnC family transcriptional regulator [Halioglobus japonicus]